MRRTTITCFVAVALTAFTFSNTARAGSFQLSEQSASGVGVAFASGAAAAEDASVLFYNPAGIVLLDQGELQLGGHYVSAQATFRNEGSRYTLPGTPFNGLPIAGGNGGQAGVSHLIPNTYFTQPVFRGTPWGDLTVGLGVTVPFGLETDYNPNWVGRYQALRTKLTTFDIQPTIAWRLWDRLSIGASIDFERASARLSQAIDFGLIAQQPLGQFYAALPAALAARGVPAAAIPATIASIQQAYAAAGFVPGGRDGVLELSGDDWDVGFTIGAMFEYLKKGSDTGFLQDGRIGMSYRSEMEQRLEGPADFRRVPLIAAPGALVQFPNPTAFQTVFFPQNGMATLDLPDIFRFSLYQRFARQFGIMGDITWTRWSKLQSVPIVFSNPGTPATMLDIRYDDAMRYAVGLEWYACPSLTLRTGFAYDETPIQSPAFRTPRVPDNNRYFLSAGLKWAATSWMDVDLGYAHLFVDDPKTNLLDTQGHQLIGTYDAHVDIVSASVTFKWGGPRGHAESYTRDTKDVSYRK